MTRTPPCELQYQRPRITRTILLLLTAVQLVLLVACAASHRPTRQFAACDHSLELALLPEAYGEVVFHHDGASANHLYIIGVGHRDAITRRNGEKTARIQAEVYKTAEWLVLNKDVELLVPEGFFEKAGGQTGVYNRDRGASRLKGASLKRLERCFADEKNPTHAGMLLLKNYRLRVKQVEDRSLYDAALNCLVKLDSQNPSASQPLEAELKYLQERRTATMLQRIPEIVGNEFHEGNIRRKQAIFTIGLNHLPEIIQYVNTKRIEVCPPPRVSSWTDHYVADVNLLHEDFGITIIIPRTAAQDDDVMKMTRLDAVLATSRTAPTTP